MACYKIRIGAKSGKVLAGLLTRVLASKKGGIGVGVKGVTGSDAIVAQ